MRHSYEPGEEEEEEAESGSSSPPSKRENDSACALADLFGGTFSLSKQKDSLVSLNDQAGDEMKKIHWISLEICSVGGGSTRLLSPYFLI